MKKLARIAAALVATVLAVPGALWAAETAAAVASKCCPPGCCC